MIYLIAQDAVNGWVQAGVVVAIITVVLDRVFALLKPLLQKKNGNGACKHTGPCEASEQLRSVYLRGRPLEVALVEEKEKDDSLKQMAADIKENKIEQKRTRRIAQASLARDVGCNPNEINPDETGVGMTAIDPKD